MKHFLFLTVFTINALIFSACSAANEPKNAVNLGANTAAVNANNQTIQSAAPSNMITTSEAEKKSREVFNNEGNANVQTTAEVPKNSKDNIYAGRSAPDDSTFNSAMNEKGQIIETRAFKNHPQLAKVERIYNNPKDKKIYVYLKNGKVIELADEKISNFQADSPGGILEAADVQIVQPTPGPNDETKNVEKKRAN